MEYITVREASQQWGISDRRIRLLCEQGKIKGAIKDGKAYKIPKDATKPADGRLRRGQIIPQEYSDLLNRVDGLKAKLSKRRPLTQGELKRLQDEFLVAFTYNSNAIEGNIHHHHGCEYWR